MATSSTGRGIFKAWTAARVVFNEREAEDWVDRKPVSDEPKDVLDWAEAHPFVKTAKAEVPSSITSGEKFTLHDVRVAPPRKKGKGPRIMDDDIYDLFPHVRAYVPRGLCILHTETNGTPKYEIIVSAMRKFTGGPGDEDDEEEEENHDGATDEGAASVPKWERYFIEPYTNSATILHTTKENGEASHLSAVKVGQTVYYVIGSKNVHILLKTLDEIALYTEQRFTVANMIARTMITFLHDRISPAQRDTFINYMVENKFTATFEYLQLEHQHVELFDFSESKFRFIAFTHNSRFHELCFSIFSYGTPYMCALRTFVLKVQ